MTSKIIVNNIESDVGISSVTFNDTISGDLEGNINSSGTSTFNVISGVSTIGVTTVHLTGINDLSYPTAGPLSKRNLIINGSFMVSQRSTSETVSGQGTAMRTVDRFSAKFFGSGWASNHSTESQSTDAPPGHSHSYKVLADVAQDYSSALGSWIQYSFEGNQLLPLKTANLGYKEFTISFWLKSNKTGNVTVSGETAGQGHCFSTTVSINAANTWEYKTVTFPASPSSQLSEAEFRSIDAEFNIKWGLGSNGSWLVGTDESWQPYATNRGVLSSLQTNFQQSANDYLAIGGIQMEAGSNATEFEYRSYAEELTLCLRYYWSQNVADSASDYGAFSLLSAYSTSTDIRGMINFPVPMRILPSLDHSQISDFAHLGGAAPSDILIADGGSNVFNCGIRVILSGNQTANYASILRANNNQNAEIMWDAEL